MASVLYPNIKNTYASLAYYGMRLLVLISGIGFIFLGEWMSALNAFLVLGIIFIPRLIKSQYELYLPFAIELAIVTFVFLSVFLGSLYNYYEKFALWDGILHFQSGLLLGTVGFLVIYLLNSGNKKKLVMSAGFVAFFAVCFSLAMSVFWEIFEYAADTWFGYTMQESGLPDTMSDLVINGIGAIIVAILGYIWMKKSKQLPFTPDEYKAPEIV